MGIIMIKLHTDRFTDFNIELCDVIQNKIVSVADWITYDKYEYLDVEQNVIGIFFKCNNLKFASMAIIDILKTNEFLEDKIYEYVEVYVSENEENTLEDFECVYPK